MRAELLVLCNFALIQSEYKFPGWAHWWWWRHGGCRR